MREYTLPSLGADMEGATLVEWKVKPGDALKRGDIIAVVETVKGAIDVEIFEDAVVERLLVEPGRYLKVGEAMAVLRALAEKVEAAPAPAAPVSPATPAVAGSSASPRTMREAIGAAMARSKREIPHYYLQTRIDLGRAMEWLEAENRRRPVTERLLPAALLLRAVARALREVPELNGRWEGEKFEPSASIHLGVAINLRQGGLVAPAILDADRLSVDALMPALLDLVQRARSGGLKGSELSSPTITVTNLGDLGVESVLGVIYPPQVAIVGFGRISSVPWVREGQVVVRPVVTASLSADHRVSDGHRGGLFLSAIDRILQEVPPG